VAAPIGGMGLTSPRSRMPIESRPSERRFRARTGLLRTLALRHKRTFSSCRKSDIPNQAQTEHRPQRLRLKNGVATMEMQVSALAPFGCSVCMNSSSDSPLQSQTFDPALRAQIAERARAGDAQRLSVDFLKHVDDTATLAKRSGAYRCRHSGELALLSRGLFGGVFHDLDILAAGSSITGIVYCWVSGFFQRDAVNCIEESGPRQLPPRGLKSRIDQARYNPGVEFQQGNFLFGCLPQKLRPGIRQEA